MSISGQAMPIISRFAPMNGLISEISNLVAGDKSEGVLDRLCYLHFDYFDLIYSVIS